MSSIISVAGRIEQPRGGDYTYVLAVTQMKKPSPSLEDRTLYNTLKHRDTNRHLPPSKNFGNVGVQYEENNQVKYKFFPSYSTTDSSDSTGHGERNAWNDWLGSELKKRSERGEVSIQRIVIHSERSPCTEYECDFNCRDFFNPILAKQQNLKFIYNAFYVKGDFSKIEADIREARVEMNKMSPMPDTGSPDRKEKKEINEERDTRDRYTSRYDRYRGGYDRYRGEDDRYRGGDSSDRSSRDRNRSRYENEDRGSSVNEKERKIRDEESSKTGKRKKSKKSTSSDSESNKSSSSSNDSGRTKKQKNTKIVDKDTDKKKRKDKDGGSGKSGGRGEKDKNKDRGREESEGGRKSPMRALKVSHIKKELTDLKETLEIIFEGLEVLVLPDSTKTKWMLVVPKNKENEVQSILRTLEASEGARLPSQPPQQAMPPLPSTGREASKPPMKALKVSHTKKELTDLKETLEIIFEGLEVLVLPDSTKTKWMLVVPKNKENEVQSILRTLEASQSPQLPTPAPTPPPSSGPSSQSISTTPTTTATTVPPPSVRQTGSPPSLPSRQTPSASTSSRSQQQQRQGAPILSQFTYQRHQPQVQLVPPSLSTSASTVPQTSGSSSRDTQVRQLFEYIEKNDTESVTESIRSLNVKDVGEIRHPDSNETMFKCAFRVFDLNATNMTNTIRRAIESNKTSRGLR